MNYYMKPGEQEAIDEQERNARRLGQVLIGQKTPPEDAVIKKLKERAVGYYETCAFPKPGKTKKKKKANGWKDKASRVCYYCGTYGAERHEVYPGTGRRQICIDEGFQVDLCPECHRMMHEGDSLEAQGRDMFWRQKYQREYEEKLIDAGTDPEKAREVWLGLIGRNYL